jgi:ketosteroid isomerase-like protein
MAKKKKDKKQKKAKKQKLSTAAPKDAKKKKKKDSGKKKGEKASDHKMRALARRIVDMTTSNADQEIFQVYADDVESIEMNMPAMVGLDAMRKKLEGWNEMVSDPSFKAANVWVDGNNIIIEWIGDVTLKATGKRAQLREIAIHEIKNGKIARERYYYDPAALQP